MGAAPTLAAARIKFIIHYSLHAHSQIQEHSRNFSFKAEVVSCKRKEIRYQMFPEETKTLDYKGNLKKDYPKGQVNAGFHS